MQRTYTLINDTSADAHIGCNAVTKSIRQGAQMRGYSEAATHKAGEIITGHDYDRLLSGSHLIVINGEGSMHDDSKACRNIAHFVSVAKEHGKRVALINTSYSDNSRTTGDLICKADLIGFRDSNSMREFLLHHNANQITVAGDLSLQSFEKQELQSKKSSILVTDSVTPSKTADLIAFALSRKARFAPAQDRSAAASSNNPLRILRKKHLFSVRGLIRNTRGWIDVAANTSHKHLLQIGQKANLIITGRYHVVAYAISFQIPFLYTPSNTGKIDWFLSDIGIDINKRKIRSLQDLMSMSDNDLLTQAIYDDDELDSIKQFLMHQKIACRDMLDAVFNS